MASIRRAIIVIPVVLWLLGLLYNVAGGLIHVILVIAGVIFSMQGRSL